MVEMLEVLMCLCPFLYALKVPARMRHTEESPIELYLVRGMIPLPYHWRYVTVTHYRLSKRIDAMVQMLCVNV
jgi:hypothetical protein